MEHSNLFLSSLWIHAVFVDPAVSTTLGFTYVGLRSLYPVIWALVGGADGAPMRPYTWFFFGDRLNLFYITFPQYGIVFYLALSVVFSLGFDMNLNAMVKMPGIVAPLGFGLFLYHFALGGFPILQGAMKPYFAKKKSARVLTQSCTSLSLSSWAPVHMFIEMLDLLHSGHDQVGLHV